MSKIPEETVMALAARNEIVRQMGECTIPLIVLHKAILAAEEARDKMPEHAKA
jgi:hypothetical protein